MLIKQLSSAVSLGVALSVAILIPEMCLSQQATGAQTPPGSSYILGPQDSLTIRVLNADELGDEPYPIDLNGDVTLPRVGRIHAGGLTIDEFRDQVTDKFKEFLRSPTVTVAVAEFRSQPVSVLGEVDTPGVHQIRGRNTLFEVISEAGGLRDDAGNTIKITRRKEWGSIPLRDSVTTPDGEYTIAHVSVHSVLEALNPLENIAVKPYDVITVPKADLVYVVGAVNKAGGFMLSEKANISVLQALSLAEGLQHTSGPSAAKILRSEPGTTTHTEIPINVKKILAGKSPDLPMVANDILFIPTSAAKTASLRAIEAIVQTGTGMAVYGRF
jgi:polysaccharide biosynthesis/export protein